MSQLQRLDIDTILKLDLKAAMLLARKEGVSLTGLCTIQEIRHKMIQHFAGTPLEQDYGGFLTAQKDTDKVTKHLLDMIQNAASLHDEFPRKLRHNLEQSYPDIVNQFKEKKEYLRKGEVWIIVSGEVGAGKSSAINLILDCQLLPTDALRCTNTIVEIRCSDKKEAICYYSTKYSNSMRRQRRISPKILNLDSKSGLQEFNDSIREYDDAEDNPYERIELYYPFKTLGKGVVLVDTPGVEGGNNINHRLQKYLSKAFGFIYVINTNAAGGVQQSRLGHLLKTVVNTTEDISPEASLFIANKWENVPVGDRPDVQKDIFDKLVKVYPGIKPNQVHYMSVHQSMEMFARHKQQKTEHSELLAKIGKLVPSSLRQGMTKSYWWLSSFYARSAYLLRVTGVQHEMSREELERKCAQMQKQVAELQRSSDDIVKKLREKVEFEIFRITNMIKEELLSRRFMDYVCNWENATDCPPVSRRWKNIANEAAVRISDRIAQLVDNWQRQNDILSIINKEIINVFAKGFGLLEHQIEDMEDFLTNSKGRNTFLKPSKVVPVRNIFARKRGKVDRIYNTLGGAVSCIGMLDTDKREVKRVFRDYSDRNRSVSMSEATVLYIRCIVDHKDMGSKLRKYFNRFFKDIDEAAKRLPVFLQADQQLIETLTHSMNELESVQEKLPELVTKCADQHGSLDIFFVNDIMHFDYEMDELDWDNKCLIGEGSFAKVYKSEIKRKNRTVALKVSSETVQRDNVTDILTEDRTMRNLRHPNVIRYYGACYVKESRGLKWIMVLEMCKESLKEYYTDSPFMNRRVPGLIPPDSPRRREAVRQTLQHALDIAKGLEYIHEKGFTHRDMKMENILIADDASVKITDVGVAKPTHALVRTCNGSPAYMAPEVLLSNRNQSNKIDIYSTALIYWEMWFGVEVTVDMNREVLGGGFHGDAMHHLKRRMSDPKGGWRPHFRSANRPSEQMIEMIKQGWDDDPDERPTATDFVNFFTAILKFKLATIT